MTGDYFKLSSFTRVQNGGDVSFKENSKGKIVVGINSNAIGVNVLVYITSNIMISIQDSFHMN